MRRGWILLGILLIGLGAVFATAWQAYARARESIESSTFDRLTSVRETKRRAISDYLDQTMAQVELLSRSRCVAEALVECGRSFNNGSPGPGDAADVTEFYEGEFAPRYGRNESVGGLVPSDPDALRLQARFLARNPHPVGSKHELADDGSNGYGDAHAAHHQAFRDVIDAYGYYDLFLIDAETGHIVYSVFKEIDFATSLRTGPHADSNLGDAYRASLDTDGVVFVDYEPYTPSYGAPAAFLAQRVEREGRTIGVVAVQIPIDRIEHIMTGGRQWRTDGLGESGETYLVGADGLMRSDSRFILEFPERFFERQRAGGGARVNDMERHGTTILFQDVSTEASRGAIAGESGTRIVDDYRGLPVLSSFAPIDFAGTRWAILSEIDADEAFAPVAALRARVAGMSAFVAALFLGLAAVLSVMLGRNDRMSRERDRIDRDLGIAKSIQQGLLPSGSPSVEGFDIAGWSMPADETGGDYFDWQQLPDGRLAVTLGDVTGHGIGPALVTAVCRAYARASLPDSKSLGAVMNHINTLLHQDLPEERFITFVVGLLDPDRASIELLSAGHAPILVYRAATREIDVGQAHDIPMGILGETDYDASDHIDFEVNDMLVLVTDGFFEWQNPANEQYGIRRMCDRITASADKSSEQIIRDLHEDVLRFAGGTSQDDDLTAIVIKRMS